MKKSDKYIDKVLIQALTEVCEIAKVEYDGFQWLTHFVNYSSFPSSLIVVCIYDTNQQLANTNVNGLRVLIKEKLISIDIHIKDLHKQINFDTEEDCYLEHNGNWNIRFR